MTGWILVGALATGLGRPGAAANATKVDYCPMVLETATRVLGPFTDDATTLEKGCVQDAASAGGVMYAEAIGFEPMPLKTVTCEGNGWVVQIGQSPPKAPTTYVIQLGFERERHGARRFWAQLLHSNWRDDSAKGRIRAPHGSGCGPVKGVVKRQAGRWVIRTIPQKTP
jgi:hypothetical protein